MGCGVVAAVVDMAAIMVSMATPVVAGLRGLALPTRRTASKMDLTSGDAALPFIELVRTNHSSSSVPH